MLPEKKTTEENLANSIAQRKKYDTHIHTRIYIYIYIYTLDESIIDI